MSFQCQSPHMMKDEQVIPCGKCEGCFSRRTAHWQFRLMQEEKHSVNAYFITLTYDTMHVPMTHDGLFTLNRKDVPAFIKRVRSFTHYTNKLIRQGKKPKVDDNWITDLPPLKYYAVGEYGGKFKRPHYHLIVFNVNLDAVVHSWDLGRIHVGSVTGASVGYTLKYISKRTYEGYFEGDSRTPTFSQQSKGLGLAYLTEAIKNYHQDPQHYYLTLEGGMRLPMARYYRDKLFTQEEYKALLEELKRAPMPSITEESYYEACYQNWVLQQANFKNRKPLKPLDVCLTIERKKRIPQKRQKNIIRRSQSLTNQ